MILCMNAATGGISEWDLEWLGVAGHDGDVHGITATTLETLGANGDEPDFTAEIRTGELDLGTTSEKNVPKAYFDVMLGGDAEFVTGVAKRGATTDFPYPLVQRDDDETDNGAYRRRDLARGNRAPWWAFGLSGKAWYLGALEVRVAKLSKRF